MFLYPLRPEPAAVDSGGSGIYFVDDGTNTLDLLY